LLLLLQLFCLLLLLPEAAPQIAGCCKQPVPQMVQKENKRQANNVAKGGR
jgi:hypothetical protein